MSLRLCSLSSGSSGNCVYVASNSTSLIIDCGVSANYIAKGLKALRAGGHNGLSLLVTHKHTDHISGVKQACEKLSANVYSHFLTTDDIKKQLKKGDGSLNEFGDDSFSIGDILVSPFRVSHDVPTVGFKLESGGKTISVLTDLGHLPDSTIDKISDSDIVLIESNHDEELVCNNLKYPYYLKRRILSQKGHLSNSDCAEAVVRLAKGGVKQIVLAHLSQENNYPELAFNTVSQILRINGIIEGKDIKIEVAPAQRLSGLFEVC